jgi:hypothetical protein
MATRAVGSSSTRRARTSSLGRVSFTDRVKINVKGGHGGGGAVSFRREARTPKGGPDGGNGGDGGSVYLIADPEVEDLRWFRHVVHHAARPGEPGSGRRRHGRRGEDAVLPVPVGTRVLRDDEVIATLDTAGERAEVARGGQGGIGNYAFRSSTHQTPRESVPGTPGDETWLVLELRLDLAAAIVGLPNTGKSALLNALTGARSPVAPYPRSTRDPEFGPIEDDAGHLMTIERARVIVHCVDGREPDAVPGHLASVRDGIAPFRAAGQSEIVVATFSDPAMCPAGADFAVDLETGAGVDAVRAAIVQRMDV